MDYEKAYQMMNATDWDALLCGDYVNCSATNWHNKFMDIYEGGVCLDSHRISFIIKHNTIQGCQAIC